MYLLKKLSQKLMNVLPIKQTTNNILIRNKKTSSENEVNIRAKFLSRLDLEAIITEPRNIGSL
jgi:hypothetical protein